MPGWPANADASGALAAASGAGPYFTIEPWAEGEGWRSATLLVSDPAVPVERVSYARAVIADRAGIAPAEVPERALPRLSSWDWPRAWCRRRWVRRCSAAWCRT